jgi:hypothetical protein
MGAVKLDPPDFTLRTMGDLAWQVARLSPEWARLRPAFRSEALKPLWQHSRRLCKQWDEDIARWNRLADEQAHADGSNSPAAISGTGLVALCGEALISEIYTTELLLRLTAAIIVSSESEKIPGDATRVIRNLLRHTAAVRRKLLQSVLDRAAAAAQTSDSDAADTTSEESRETTASSSPGAGMIRIAHRLERWTDVLLAPLVAVGGTREFCFDDERCADYSSFQVTGARTLSATSPAELLTLYGLRRALIQSMTSTPLVVQAYRDLAQCLQSEVQRVRALIPKIADSN